MREKIQKAFKILVILFFLYFYHIPVQASESSSSITFIHPTSTSSSSLPYSPGVSVDLSQGKLLFVSGQVAYDPKTGKLLEKNITTATRQTLDNIEAILKAAGSDWKHVVRMEVFLKNFNDFDGMNAEYKKRFPSGIFPARQTVQVGMPNLVEISCIAFVPDSHRTS